MNDYDIGKDMSYCEIHKCWWPVGEHCGGCEIAKVAKCVEGDGVWVI